MFNSGDKVIILKSDCFYFVGKKGVVIPKVEKELNIQRKDRNENN